MAEVERLRQNRKRREYWIVGPEYSDAEKEFRVVWGALETLGLQMDHPGSYNNPESGQMRISLFGERFVIAAKSAKYPQSLVGEGLSGVVFSEAAKLKPSVYYKYLRPTLADFGGWALFSSTPEGKNWFYDFWDIGQDKSRLDWDSWRAPSWINTHVYRTGVDEELLERIKQARVKGRMQDFLFGIEKTQADMGLVPIGIDAEIWSLFLDTSLEMFNQEVAALFTEYVGRVFKNYDEETHVTDQGLRRDWKTYAAVDYGFTNPFVWLLIQVDPHNERIHIVDEYYETQKTTGEAAREIRARGLAPNEGDCRVLRIYPDPSEPDRTRELSGILGIPAHGGGSIPLADRLEWIRRKLGIMHQHLEWGHPERVPQLTIARKCVQTRREMDAYRYPETAEKAAERGREAPEAPMKKDDHAPEALGRFMSGYFGSPWAERGGARQSRVRVGR